MVSPVHYLTLILATIVLTAVTPLRAQEPAPDEQVATRIGQLEEQTELLQAQIRALKERQLQLERLPAVNPTGDPGVTMDQVRGEIKKAAWKKGDLTVTPYGILWGSAVWETQRSYPGAYILWMDSFSTNNEDASYFDARSTRLGLDLAGPKFRWCPETNVTGKVEFDFQSSAGPRLNQGTVLLRHAYIKADNGDSAILFGQTWDTISPLYPTMLGYIPAWGSGNIGYRRPQLRYDRNIAFSDYLMFKSQTSLNLASNWDFNTDPTVIGQTAGWPVLEGRWALQFGERTGPRALPKEIGFSAHIGEEIYDVRATPTRPAVDNLARRTWSANVDISFPITQRLKVQAEFFTGENLSTYLGGILQGLNPVTFNGIRTTGGWVELGYYWTPCFHTHVGYAIDDPFNQDLAVAQRSYNHQIFANVVYDITKKWLVGLEVSSWKTYYVDRRPGEGVRFEFVSKYAF